jgi:hypothetical protein
MPPSAWDTLNPYDQLGLSRMVPQSAMSSGSPSIATASGPSRHDNPSPFSPDSPLFWIGALLLATAGLIGVSTSARVGPLRTSASLGKS